MLLFKQQQIVMLSEIKTDDRVRLFIRINQPVTYAGQYLEGDVNVEVLQDTNFKEIKMSLIASQAASWSAAKTQTSYQNKKQTYNEELLLNRFEQKLKKGHYCFPFNILLPATFPANLFINATNYIAYRLRAFLLSNDEKDGTPQYKLFLNIREPLRMVSSLSQYGSTTSQCWKCLGPKRSGVFHLQLQKNEIRNDEKFIIKGFIDNTNGQFGVSEFQVVLSRRISKIAENGTASIINQDIATLIRPKNGVGVGAQKKFEAEIKLPQSMVDYTAIGNIISKTFFICLVIQPSCFYKGIRIQKHILINNNIPNHKIKNITIPKDWNPQESPCRSFIALKPYLFNPSPHIQIINQKGAAVSKVNEGQFSIQNLMKSNDL